MLHQAIQYIIQKRKRISEKKALRLKEIRIKKYFNSGRIPWSEGYSEYKERKIIESLKLTDSPINILPEKYGIGIDERIVELPWALSRLSNKNSQLLDAGSSFNFEFLIDTEILKRKKLFIFTYAPEKNAYPHKGISYIYGDLRKLPFNDKYFDEIVSVSTIEHIDMDNSLYGYNLEHHQTIEEKSFQYLVAIKEFVRCLKPQGKLLLSFPYGQFENHKFFQQFDKEMILALEIELHLHGYCKKQFFKYSTNGWELKAQDECDNSQSYNPHSGVGKGSDGAAHCRAICCIEFIANAR